MAYGVTVKKPEQKTFEIVQKYVDDIYCVDEMEIARTMTMVLERNKLLERVQVPVHFLHYFMKK